MAEDRISGHPGLAAIGRCSHCVQIRCQSHIHTSQWLVTAHAKVLRKTLTEMRLSTQALILGPNKGDEQPQSERITRWLMRQDWKKQ